MSHDNGGSKIKLVASLLKRCAGRWLMILVAVWLATSLSESAAAQQGPQRTTNPRPVRAKQPAPPFTINKEHEKYLDQILDFWEFKSNQIKTFSCKFTRLEFDPTWGPKDRTKHKTQSEGVIKYAKPDKAMFRVDKVREYTRPRTPGAEPDYVLQKNQYREHWICDGKSVVEMNAAQKQLIERRLPEHLQGTAIADGPVPFLFRANKDKLKRRYWMRVVTPRGVKDKYWIEAVPRHRRDTANYTRVEIALDAKDYLPKEIWIYQPDGVTRTGFAFTGRKVNDPLERLRKDFYKPRVPRGWTKVVENYDIPAGGRGTVPPPRNNRQAKKPGRQGPSR